MMSRLSRIFGIFVGVAGATVALPAHANFHLFLINEVFSSADGKVQFVELIQTSPEDPYGYGSSGNGENLWAGNTLISSNGTTQQVFVFPANLPSPLTADRSVLVATQSFAALGVVTPDYVVPDGFFAYPNGSLNYANVDAWNYTGLPLDGRTSMDRSGTTQPNSPTNFKGDTGSVTVTAIVNGVIEFYNTGLNHFFVTANSVEAASVDAGGSGPGWQRTGNVFKSGGPNSVCRFYGVQAAGGPNGHFYTADPDECNQVKLDPGWHFESLDFSITPAVNGACPQGLVPVYRAYNKRFAQHDSNHRLTTSLAAYQQQIAAGWAGEGIVMCAQP